MTTIDDMLRAPSEVTLHPVVRWVKARRQAGDDVRVELHRSEPGLGSTTTQLVIVWRSGGQEQPPQPYDWDDELNSALIGEGVRAASLPQEAERFALGLRAALRKVERRYGDGYLNAVLIDLIDESALSKDGEIAEVRRFIKTNSPERNSRTYSDCREAIASEIGGRAVELREKLQYGPDELKAVMEKALALYLDERFSVTRRRTLGWF